MTAEQRAMQMWSLLVVAARAQQLLSYKTVGQVTGLPPQSQAGFLGRVAMYCRKKNLPPLTAIVVSQESGLPGYSGSEEKGLEILQEQSRDFVFDWLSWLAAQEQPLKEEDFKEPWPSEG
jgi:hypothetical protein